MKLLRHPVVSQPLTALIAAAVLVVQSNQLWAQVPDDPINRGSQAGQLLGADIFPDASRLGTADANGNVILFPGQARELNIGAAELFPGAGSTLTVEQLRNSFNNPAGIEAMGRDSQTGLAEQNDQTGEAYRTVTGSRDNMAPDLRGDPVWGQTGSTVSNLESIRGNFAHCTTTRAFASGSMTAHVPDLRTCDRVYDPGATFTLHHAYVANMVQPVSGPSNFASCGADCLEMWVGRVGNDYYSGNCTVFEEEVVFRNTNPNAIRSAHVVRVVYDDYMQIWLGGTKVWSGPNGDAFPPETAGRCELSRSRDQALAVDVTSLLKQEGEGRFRIRTSVTGRGEGYALVRIVFNPGEIIQGDDWGTNEDIARLVSASDGFCTANVSCDIMPPLDAGNCATMDGIRVCPENFTSDESRFMAGFVNPICRQATVNLSCGFTSGPMECWTDANGNRQCPVANGPRQDTCAPLRQNASCGFVRTECVEGAQGPSGTCYVYQDVYDCGYSTEIPSVTPTTEISCPGPIRCMGTECTNPVFESNNNFAQAAASLQALQMIGQDGTCTAADAAAGSCELFPGEARTCKRAVGGMVNCCEQPGGVSLGDYLKLVMAIGKVDSAIMSMEGTSQLRGAWEVLRSPLTDTWAAAKDAWTSTVNSVTGSTTSAATNAASQGLIEQAKQAMIRQTAEWTVELFGTEATNMLFSTVATDATTGLAGAAVVDGSVVGGSLQLGGGQAIIGTALGWIMWAYMVYQVFTILVNIIWACEESEFQLGVERQLKSCHLVGSYCNTSFGTCIERRESYCCFNSPLSRILQEQIRPQLGMDWGTARNPQCGGLTITQFGSADWTRVDLSEWVAILNAEGLIPDPTTVTLQSLTGSGREVLNAASPTGTRPDALTRTQERLQGMDIQDLQSQSLDQLRGAAAAP